MPITRVFALICCNALLHACPTPANIMRIHALAETVIAESVEALGQFFALVALVDCQLHTT